MTPTTEQDRQFWWDHFRRQDELKAQIAQWEAAAAPTAGELALRETRLKELRQELARMEMRERQARGDFSGAQAARCRERGIAYFAGLAGGVRCVPQGYGQTANAA